MTQRHNDPLLLAGRILCLFMQGAMLLAAAATSVAFIAVAFFNERIQAEIAVEAPDLGAMPVLAILGLLALLVPMLGLIFLFFGKLRQVIATVGEGDPFAPANADRLTFMGWSLVGVYLLAALASTVGYAVAQWATRIEGVQYSGRFDFDLTGVLTILVLFILARVFRHGAAMRDDLEGTV